MNTKLKWVLMLSALAAIIGCARPRLPDPLPPPESIAITQVGYGAGAKYVTCPLSGCSRPTPKTLIGAPSDSEPEQQTGSMEPLAPPAPVVMAAVTAPAVMQPVVMQQPVAPTPVVATPAAAKEVALPEEPTSAGPSEATPPARTFITFPVRSARLTEEAKRQLDELAPFVKSAQRVVIKGRTDESGDVDTNDRLAFRRALAVREHLRIAAKADDKAFQLLAKGACCYIASNATEAGRAENRRAEVDFILPEQTSASSTRRASGKAHSS